MMTEFYTPKKIDYIFENGIKFLKLPFNNDRTRFTFLDEKNNFVHPNSIIKQENYTVFQIDDCEIKTVILVKFTG